MWNLIRADFYRIIRGIALYITLAVVLALNLLIVGTLHAFQSGAFDESLEAAAAMGNADALDAAMAEIQAMTINGVQITSILTGSMENFLWFLLPIVIVVASTIFTHGTVKNDIAFGLSRTKLYVSKLLLATAIGIVFLLFYMGTGMLLATLFGGFGGPAPVGHWSNLFQVLGLQFILIFATICIGIFLAFTTKRTAAVNGIFIALLLVPPLVISLLELASPGFSRLFDYDISYNTIRLSRLGCCCLETRDLMHALGLGAFYILATTIGGIALFRRAEIK